MRDSNGGTAQDVASAYPFECAGAVAPFPDCMTFDSADFPSAADSCDTNCSPELPCGTSSAEQAILEKLYRSERAKLRAFLGCRAKPEDVNDLVHEVFLRAAASEQLRKLVNPGGFLCRIARNVLIDRARRESCRINTASLDERSEPSCAAEQHAMLEADDLRMRFENALASLPPKTRRVFKLSREKHRSYREIHKELGISCATVEYHMMKALAHLRTALAQVE